MTDIIVDANIFLNVLKRETDFRTGKPLWKPSSTLLTYVSDGILRGNICFVTVLEIVHAVRVNACKSGSDETVAMRLALKAISDFGFKQIIPEPFILQNSLSFMFDLRIDPYDAVLLATALGTDMDAIISRDEKFTAKASKLIPVLSPEELLEKISFK